MDYYVVTIIVFFNEPYIGHFFMRITWGAVLIITLDDMSLTCVVFLVF